MYVDPVHADPALAALLAEARVEAARFSDAREAVAVRMDTAVFRRPDLGLLIGDVAPSTVRELHRQHAAFLAAALALGVSELLLGGLPSVYRGFVGRGLPRDYLDVAPGLWADVVREEFAGAAPAVLGVHAWLARHADAWLPARPVVSGRGPAPDSPAGRLTRALLGSDPIGARGTVRRELARGVTLPEVFREVISPALHEIGRRWETGRISVAQEHVASAMVARILAELAQDLPGRGTRMAVVSAAPGEPHEFGAWMVADVLRAEGWEVRFLGASLPRGEIAGYVAGSRPELVALSCTLPVHLPGLGDLVRDLREDPVTAGIPVLVGGQAFGPGDVIWRIVGADGFATDATGIVDEARRLVAVA